MKWSKKILYCLSIVALPIVSYFYLGPLEIYSSNQKDFQFGLADFAIYFVLVSIILYGFSSMILATLPQKVFDKFLYFICGFGVASYVQNNFLNTRLSDVTGKRMNWNSLGAWFWVSSAIFVAIVLAVFVLLVVIKNRGLKVAAGTSLFLTAIQIVAVASLLFSVSPKSDNEVRAYADNHMKMADENVIVFIMDAVGNVEFEQALADNSNFADTIKDFTYFDNMDCHYFTTFPSISHMLTGMEFDFEPIAQDWLEDAWNSNKAVEFYNSLKSQGYQRWLFVQPKEYVFGNAENLCELFDNVHSQIRNVDSAKIFRKLLRESIYKYVPYIVKPYFEVLTEDFNVVIADGSPWIATSTNYDYYQKLITQRLSKSEDADKAFIVEYIDGIHDGNSTGSDVQHHEDASVEDTMQGLFKIITEYLNQMKQIEVYDNSTIIFCADHGLWLGGKDPQPFFLIKQKGETHDGLITNSSMASYDDLINTFAYIAGIDNSDYGKTIFDWENVTDRYREVYMRDDNPEYPKVKNSGFNVYYKVLYNHRVDVEQKMKGGDYEIVPANEWR